MGVFLYQSHDQALFARKRRAEGAFGHTFTTPGAYFLDQWELWGDGRVLVGGSERLALVLEALRMQGGLASSLGTAQVIASFAERYAGCSQLCELACGGACALASKGGAACPAKAPDSCAAVEVPFTRLTTLGSAETDLAHVLGVYFALLAEHALVERGCALRAIEDMPSSDCIEVASPIDFSVAERSFLEKRGCAVPDLHDVAVPALAFDVEPRLLFPSGSTVTASMVYDEVMSFLEGDGGGNSTCGPASVAICARRPQEFFETLAPFLAEEGVSCGLRCRVPFADTAFGRTCSAVGVLVDCGQEGDWLAAATDFAYSPFSGMPGLEAQKLNAALRADRLSTREDACALLGEKSPTFCLFERLLEKDDCAALDSLVAMAEDDGAPVALASDLERAAMAAYGRLLEALACLSASHVSAWDLAGTLSVTVSQRADMDERAACVVFCPASDLAGLPPRSYDEVILADVSDGAFCAAKRSALDSFAEKLGIEDARLPLAGPRVSFAAAQRAARRRFTCVMPLRNEAQEEAYASFPFEEFLLAMQEAAGGAGDAEPVEVGAVLVPASLVPCVVRCGEERLVGGLGCNLSAPSGVLSLPWPQRGRLLSLRLADFMRSAHAEGGDVPVLSPSSVEAYLGCPYRWFVERRIRLNELDEGFGAVEKGLFAHAVYAAFYEALADQGLSRLPDDFEQQQAALALFDVVFDAQVARQPNEAPRSGRLAALTRAEVLEVEALRAPMRANLARQAGLPAGYDVYAHELSIEDSEGIDYAGARLVGRVDRVDVNEEARRFAVLDYKGSVSGHAAGFEENADLRALELPRKVQALIYAQALRSRLEGYACAGALYLSYRAKHDGEFAAGSFDEAAYDVSRFAKDSSCVHMNFDGFLDYVEQSIAKHVGALAAGDIMPSPKRKDSCAFCPVPLCERRTR